MAPAFKQDMPPPGGYANIYWQRTTPKTWFTAWKAFGLYAVGFAFSMWTIRSMRKRIRRSTLEENDVRLSLRPFLMAERDRRVLRMNREFRDLEAQVMKDVPGWKVGTWYGEPTYLTLAADDEWYDPQATELHAHDQPHRERLYLGFWNRDDLCADKWYSKYMPEWYWTFGVGSERPYKGQKPDAGTI